MLAKFEAMSIAFSHDGADLLSHSHGQGSADEVYQLRYGDCTRLHTVEVVIFPSTTEQIEALYTIPNCRLIPYGGGTNVTGCLWLRNKLDDIMYVSVDMRRYNHVLTVDA